MEAMQGPTEPCCDATIDITKGAPPADAVSAAAGTAMILGDNPANREIFGPNIDAAFVEMGNGVELAEVISDLAADPSLRRKYGERAREAYLKSASSEAIASNLETIISDVMNN